MQKRLASLAGGALRVLESAGPTGRDVLIGSRDA